MLEVPSQEDFVRRVGMFKEREGRDPIYAVATSLVSDNYGDPEKMANGVGVLLLVWNHAYYRYSNFSLDFELIAGFIRRNLEVLKVLRTRELTSFSSDDVQEVRRLFSEALEATIRGKGAPKSPVSVAKALHMLAPRFFPLWDNAIAAAYGYDYSENPAEKYVAFMADMAQLGDALRHFVPPSDLSLAKVLDEYNYGKFTKRWA